MNETETPVWSNWTFGNSPIEFPGIEGAPAGPPAVINATTVIPAGEVAVAAPAKTGISLPFNLSSITSISNLNDLKAMVDRMGGIEGVLSTMGKVQKFMSTMQQIAPMIKLFIGKGGKTATANNDSVSTRKRRRRRNRNRKSSARRTTAARTRTGSAAKTKKQ
ncbi:aminotransferase [Cohnella suwonensis]|uniref:Aminotransferase n=1 Tax=Cohnella suwonensis TaxID=696072 RepID=A0ABW0M0N9_9BACL